MPHNFFKPGSLEFPFLIFLSRTLLGVSETQLECADYSLTMLHHHWEKAHDNLGAGPDEHLPLAALLGIADRFQGIGQNIHSHHGAGFSYLNETQRKQSFIKSNQGQRETEIWKDLVRFQKNTDIATDPMNSKYIIK